MDGIVNVLKPPGMSSHDVVNFVRNLLNEKKAGHTGTLDPAAAGVLPICLGGATKLSSMLTGTDKEYIAEMVMGIETDSLDSLGEIVCAGNVPELNLKMIERAFSNFLGEIAQIPPMTSAIKINGKKLYELARKGEIIERQPRLVTINQLTLLTHGIKIDKLTGRSLPYIRFKVNCSKGTYIRTLCSDLGRFLESCSYMSFLVRTRVGNFNLESAYTLEELREAKEREEFDRVTIPVDEAFANLPAFVVNDEALPVVESGNWLFAPDLDFPCMSGFEHSAEDVRLYTKEGKFLGIYKYEFDVDNLKKQPRVRKYGYKSALRPIKVFC